MTRRSAFGSFVRASIRAAEAAQRQQLRALRQRERELRQQEVAAKQQAREQLRVDREAAREAKHQYLESRSAEVDELNVDVKTTIETLQTVLKTGVEQSRPLDFQQLKKSASFEPFIPPPELAPSPTPKPPEAIHPGWLGSLFPWVVAKHNRHFESAKVIYAEQLQEHQQNEKAKRIRFAEFRQQYEEKKQAFEAQVVRRSAEVDDFEASYRSADSDAIVGYYEVVLGRSEYPDSFPQRYRVAFRPDSAELVIEYDLPEMNVVPSVAEHRYVKSKDEIEAKPRKPVEMKATYRDVVAAIALRTLHEVFEGDQIDAISVCTFTGILDTIDPSNGNAIRVPVISVRTTKSAFLEINLERVDKIACLRNLGAHVSGRPDELQAVKPIVEFDMVDKRFIDQADAISSIEQRPNLLEMTPSEFEALVANLFGKMGLDTKLTRTSRDGGVDAVAFDTRPVLGGKVVIQAKRYRDTVGVSAVRDLFGTMMNEGANKGILVCTSGYGPDAYEFVKDKPVELIDGGGLLYLLREHAGVHARIVK
jgi:restriction system protein